MSVRPRKLGTQGDELVVRPTGPDDPSLTLEPLEQPVPVVSAGGANLLRRFSLEAASLSGRLYLLVAEGEAILQNDDGSWTLDGSATVTLRGNAPLLPFVRTSQGVRQLLLPVEFLTNRNVSLEVKLSW